MKSTTLITRRLGVEVELLAPPGRSRLDLARAIATSYDADLEVFFHPQSEPSLVAGSPVFHNLTAGFRIVHPRQGWVASCVDDLTLQSDLNREHAPQPGWYRIISDDERLLRLLPLHCRADEDCRGILEPLASLFGTSPQAGPEGMFRVDDLGGSSIAIAAPLPGERERACELITAPMESGHAEQLERLLGLARSLGFYPPVEGATHLHFEAGPLQSAPAIANLVQLWCLCGALLKGLVGSNPHCRRLGDWPVELLQTVSEPDFRELNWSNARARLAGLPLSKFCDLNLLNCIQQQPAKNTIEFRILPVFLDSDPLLNAADLFSALLERAEQTPEAAWEGDEPTPQAILEQLPMSPRLREEWLSKAMTLGV